jgi:hypothetical protein
LSSSKKIIADKKILSSSNRKFCVESKKFVFESEKVRRRAKNFSPNASFKKNVRKITINSLSIIELQTNASESRKKEANRLESA